MIMDFAQVTAYDKLYTYYGLVAQVGTLLLQWLPIFGGTVLGVGCGVYSFRRHNLPRTQYIFSIFAIVGFGILFTQFAYPPGIRFWFGSNSSTEYSPTPFLVMAAHVVIPAIAALFASSSLSFGVVSVYGGHLKAINLPLIVGCASLFLQYVPRIFAPPNVT
jgi:hypothetical protein